MKVTSKVLAFCLKRTSSYKDVDLYLYEVVEIIDYLYEHPIIFWDQIGPGLTFIFESLSEKNNPLLPFQKTYYSTIEKAFMQMLHDKPKLLSEKWRDKFGFEPIIDYVI